MVGHSAKPKNCGSTPHPARMELQFDEEKHEYSRNNIIIPGVTTILRKVGIIDYGPFVTPGKGERLHKIVQNYLEGTLNWEAISIEEMEALTRFCELAGKYEFAECEKILENKVYNYAGKCDYVSDAYVGDLKTGKPEPWHLLQLAAYVYCFHGEKYGMLIYMNEKKNPVREYTYQELKESFKHFIYALDVYNFQIGGQNG